MLAAGESTEFGVSGWVDAINESILAADVLTGGSLTLNNAYINDSGERTIDVDDGDVSWDIDGTYSIIFDLGDVDGTADGFFIENGTDYFRFTKSGASLLDVSAMVSSIDLSASGTCAVDSVGALTLSGGGNSYFVAASGDLSFATAFSGDLSIYSAEDLELTCLADMSLTSTVDLTLRANTGDLTLRTVTSGDIVLDSAGGFDVSSYDDMNWGITGAFSFEFDLSAITGTYTDGFIVHTGHAEGRDFFKILNDGGAAGALSLQSDLFDIDINCADDIDLSTTGGNITFAALALTSELESFDLETSGGDIDFAWDGQTSSSRISY